MASSKNSDMKKSSNVKSNFENDCLHVMDILHQCIHNPHRWNFHSNFRDAMRTINTYLSNNIHAKRIFHIIFNTKRCCGNRRRINIINWDQEHAAHPCFVYPDAILLNKNEPTHLSLKHIGSFIISSRFNNESEKIRERKLNEALLPLISRINDYPYDYIEIMTQRKPFQLEKVSLINERPSLLTASLHFATDPHVHNIKRLWVLGLSSDVTKDINFANNIPPPYCLYKLFSAGIDIIHFYDIDSNKMIMNNDTKRKLINRFYGPRYKNIFDVLLPFYLVSCKYQEPFIAAYNYLHERGDLMDGIIRIIISLAYNECKFEDIAYIQFDAQQKQMIQDVDEDAQSNMNMICNHCVLRLSHMLKEWRDWIVNEICLQFDEQQLNYLKVHIVKNKKQWKQLIIQLMTGAFLCDEINWIFIAAQYCACGDRFQVDSQRIYDGIKLFIAREDAKDLRLLLETYHLKFDAVDVWISNKSMGDYQLGLFWYFVCHLNEDTNIWSIFIAYLDRLHDTMYEMWCRLCVNQFLCEIFFKFYGSLKYTQKLQCMKSTIELLNIWKKQITHLTETELQSIYLQHCFLSCNSEIFHTFIMEHVLDIKCIQKDKECVHNLFESFKSKFPFIQMRTYNQMVNVCQWLYANDCAVYLETICQQVIQETDKKWKNTSNKKWKVVIDKLHSLQSDWMHEKI